MKIINTSSALSAITFFILLGCQTPDFHGLSEAERIIAEDSITTHIESLIDQWITDVTNENIEGVEKLANLDELFMVWQTDNDIKGWYDYKQHLVETYAKYEEISFSTTYREIRISRSGEVAWFYYTQDFDGRQNDGTNVSLQDMRVTGVLEKIDGHWMLVHFHSSYLPAVT